MSSPVPPLDHVPANDSTTEVVKLLTPEQMAAPAPESLNVALLPSVTVDEALPDIESEPLHYNPSQEAKSSCNGEPAPMLATLGRTNSGSLRTLNSSRPEHTPRTDRSYDDGNDPEPARMDGSLRAKTPTPRSRADDEDDTETSQEDKMYDDPTRPAFRVTMCFRRRPRQLLQYLRRDIDMRQQLLVIYKHRRQRHVAADTLAYETTIASASSHKYFLLMLLAESRYQFNRHLSRRRISLGATVDGASHPNELDGQLFPAAQRLPQVTGCRDDTHEDSDRSSSPWASSNSPGPAHDSAEDRQSFQHGKPVTPNEVALRDEPLLLAQLDAKLRTIAAKVRSLMDESEDNYCDATLEVARGRLFSWNWRFGAPRAEANVSEDT